MSCTHEFLQFVKWQIPVRLSLYDPDALNVADHLYVSWYMRIKVHQHSHHCHCRHHHHILQGLDGDHIAEMVTNKNVLLNGHYLCS